MTEEYEQTSRVEDWPQEAQRPQGRRAQRLTPERPAAAGIDGGTVDELQDCPYGDAGYQYLYERYDEPGWFYGAHTGHGRISPGPW